MRYCTVVNTVLYSNLSVCTVLYSNLSVCTVLCSNLSVCTVLCSNISVCTVLYSNLCTDVCTVLYSNLSVCTVLYSNLSSAVSPWGGFSGSVCHKLELERQQHNQLKHTWQRANDQFLESQRLLMRDMQRIESVLSSEQLRQVEEMKKKDQVCVCVWVFSAFTHMQGRICCFS